ncbi:MAG: hypothetical protein NTW03_09535, partial [Verrucomicrobia bacterium]|nr:hypothetical protein [Verrucomicrobiota bacterium]
MVWRQEWQQRPSLANENFDQPANWAHDAIQGNETKRSFFCGQLYMYVYNTSMKQPYPAQILQQIAQIQHMEPGKLCVMG